jgi:hypothetical protein
MRTENITKALKNEAYYVQYVPSTNSTDLEIVAET